jgi:hypothetical protein
MFVSQTEKNRVKGKMQSGVRIVSLGKTGKKSVTTKRQPIDYKAECLASLRKIDRIQRQMAKDRVETDRLSLETEKLLVATEKSLVAFEPFLDRVTGRMPKEKRGTMRNGKKA